MAKNPFLEMDMAKMMDVTKMMDMSKFGDMSKLMDMSKFGDMSKFMDMSKFGDMSKLMDMSKAFGDFKLNGVDMDAVASSQRKNLEALTAANQLAVEGMQAVARRQSEIMRQMMEGAGEAMRELMATGSPEDKAAKQTELAKSAFEQAIANMRELADLVAKSNNEAFDVINKRVAASLDEVKSMMGRKPGG